MNEAIKPSTVTQPVAPNGDSYRDKLVSERINLRRSESSHRMNVAASMMARCLQADLHGGEQ